MAITFNCSTCGKRISVPEATAGRKGKCPGCGTLLIVPALGAEAEAIPLALGDPDDTVVDGRARENARRRTSVHREIAEIGDDEFPEPEPIADETDDGFDADLPEPEPDVDEPISRAEAARRRAHESQVSDAPGESRRQSYAERRASMAKKKGGAGKWILFGLLLAVIHTAVAIIFGAFLMLERVENTKDSPLDVVLGPLKLEERVKKVERSRAAATPASTPTDGSPVDMSGAPDMPVGDASPPPNPPVDDRPPGVASDPDDPIDPNWRPNELSNRANRVREHGGP